MNLEQAKQFIQYRQDPIFFINSLKIVHPARGLTQFETYPFQDEVVKKFITHHYEILLKSRQTGGSTIVQGICLWATIFFENMRVLILSTGRDASVKFLSDIKNMYYNLPDYIKNEVNANNIEDIQQSRSSTKDNSTQLFFSNGSKLMSMAATEKTGRGQSCSLLVVDECAFIENVESCFQAISMTMSRAHITMENSIRPYGTIIISTPNGVNNFYHDMWVNAIENKNGYTPIKVHWKMIPEFVNDGGKWYRDQCQLLNWNPKSIAAELEMSFEGSADSYVPANILRRIGTKAPISYSPDKKLWIFEDADSNNTSYIFGVDPSLGVGGNGDDSSIQIIDGNTLNQVAEFATNNIIVDDFAEYIMELASYYNNPLINIESNAHGKILIEKILRSDQYLGMRLYKDDGENDIINYRDKVKTKKALKDKKSSDRYGTQLTGDFRNVFLSNMLSIIIENYFSEEEQEKLYNVENFEDYMNILNREISKIDGIIKSDRLVNQLQSFIVSRHGKPEASSGNHDDIVLAYAHALWCYSKTKMRIISTKTGNVMNNIMKFKKPFNNDIDIIKNKLPDKYKLTNKEVEEILGLDNSNDIATGSGYNKRLLWQSLYKNDNNKKSIF